jgi:hypothetical protein
MTWLTVQEYVSQMTTDMFPLLQGFSSSFLIPDVSPGV